MPGLNSSLWNQIEDETPPSTGEEIGAALAQALERQSQELGRSQAALVDGLAQSQERLAGVLARAMAEALRQAGERKAVAQAQAQKVRQWTFHIERDQRGLMTGVVAVAE